MLGDVYKRQNTFLDKTPPLGPAAGQMDTFTTELPGSGSSLEIRVIAEFAFESFAFDNLMIVAEEGMDAAPGDINCDGVIDLLDVQPFVEALTNQTFDSKADLNGDGTDDLLDVALFVALLIG